MFSVYTVCFFGHRQIDDFRMVEQRIERLIDKLLNELEYVEFLVGRDGEFDQLVTSAILRCRKRLNSANCSVTWVMPYPKLTIQTIGKSMKTTIIPLISANNPLTLILSRLFKSEITQWSTVLIYVYSMLPEETAEHIKRSVIMIIIFLEFYYHI